MYVVTITEVVPGMKGEEINARHLTVNNLCEASEIVENFWLNFGILVSITIVPAG